MSRYFRIIPLLLLAFMLCCCASKNIVTEPTPKPQTGEKLGEKGEDFLNWCRNQQEDVKTLAKTLKDQGTESDAVFVLDKFNHIDMKLYDAVNRAGLAQFTHPNEGVRKAGQICEQECMALQTELLLDKELFSTLADIKDTQGLEADSKRYLGKMLLEFKRNGVDKDETTRQQIRELNKSIIELSQTFDKNLAEDTRSIEITDKTKLAGLPEDYLKSHQPDDQGIIRITTDWPDYYPVMLYADNTELRHELWMQAMNLGYPKNVEVFKELLAARFKLANLLGYKNWAAFTQEILMVKNPENANSFIEQVVKISRPHAEKDIQALLEYKRQQNPEAKKVFPWERAYLTRLLKKQKYNYSPQDSRPYFSLSAVQNGVLDWSERLFGVRFSQAKDAKVWHESVQAYDVTLDNNLIGRIYLDLYPRENKYKSFAMFPIIQGVKGERIAEGAIVGNFPDPAKSNRPVLIDHLDVTTFFHEFGHLMHHIMGGSQRYVMFSGTATEWDFVETPSQLYEEWAWDAEVLKTFAKNEKGEPIPENLVARMKQSDLFAKALFVQQQMFYSALSLGVYQQSPEGFDPDQYAMELADKYSPWKSTKDTHFVEGFGHLVGYSSNYYTYMWSLVIVKDIAEKFHKEGMDNTELSLRYRKAILDQGGSRDANELVNDFLGRNFSFTAFNKWLEAGESGD